MNRYYLTCRSQLLDTLRSAFPTLDIVTDDRTGFLYLVAEPGVDAIAAFEAVSKWLDQNQENFSVVAY